MLERFFVKPQTIDRITECWLGPQIEQYVTVLAGRAYAPRSIHRRVPLLVKFAAFTAAKNVKQLEQAENFIEPFIADWLSGRNPDRPAARISTRPQFCCWRHAVFFQPGSMGSRQRPYQTATA